MMNCTNQLPYSNLNPADALYCRTIDFNHTAIDACVFLMEPEESQKTTFQRLDNAQSITGKVVWTTEEVLAEVDSKLNAPRPGLALAARNARAQIDRMIREHRLVVYQGSSSAPNRRPFADAAFLSRLVENCPNVPIAIITRDGDLGVDVMKMNALSSVRGARIYLYNVNSHGCLTRFNFIRRADGTYVNPNKSLLHVPFSTPAASADGTIRPMPEMREGDLLWSAAGRTYKLAEEMTNGGEASIFPIDGWPELAAKVFTSLSARKEAKCRLLQRAAASFPCDSAVMPQDILFDAEGNFRGYTMRLIKGIELTRLLTSRGQQRHAPSWNRLQYVRLAGAIADSFRDFSLAGLQIGDVSPGNILVGFNESGVLDPEKLYFIDLDSAQFGSRETGVYPADGLTPDYAPPEFLRTGVTPDVLRSPKNQIFSAALLCLQVAMCGVHPYRKTVTEEGQSLNVAASIAAGAFPYSAGSNVRTAVSPDGADKLFSNMPSDAKKFFYGIFQQGGVNNAVEKRPSFFALSKALNNYVSWLEKPETRQRYPEALSTAPQALKPFYSRCTHRQCPTPDQEFVVTSFRSDGRYFCPGCLARVRAQREQAAAPFDPAPCETFGSVPAAPAAPFDPVPCETFGSVPAAPAAPFIPEPVVPAYQPKLVPDSVPLPTEIAAAAPSPELIVPRTYTLSPYTVKPGIQRPPQQPTPLVRKIANWLGF